MFLSVSRFHRGEGVRLMQLYALDQPADSVLNGLEPKWRVNRLSACALSVHDVLQAG